MNPGVFFAAGAFVLWGVFPIYFKAVREVPALQILAHRIVWSLALLLVVLALQRRWSWVRAALADRRVLAHFGASAALISVNWGLYIWAVNGNHVVETSLGYFINPLVNVLLGALVLHERLRPGQKFALGLAAAAVAWLTWRGGSLPWISLALALSFGLYGLLRKTAALGAIEGLALEVALLFPFAAGYLLWLAADGQNTFAGASIGTQALLLAAGPITAAPLLLFAAGARRIPLSLVGVLQYIAPTMQWLLGVYVYREAFDAGKAVGFAIIWAALVLYAAESLWTGWRAGQAQAG